MTLLSRLGHLLGVRTDEVECVLREDASRARTTVRLQRRAFLGAAAALAAAPFVPKTFLALEPIYRTPELGLLTGTTFYLGTKVLTIRERVHKPFWDALLAVDATATALLDDTELFPGLALR